MEHYFLLVLETEPAHDLRCQGMVRSGRKPGAKGEGGQQHRSLLMVRYHGTVPHGIQPGDKCWNGDSGQVPDSQASPQRSGSPEAMQEVYAHVPGTGQGPGRQSCNLTPSMTQYECLRGNAAPI